MPASAKSARRHRVREVDFRRPSKFTRDQVRRIETAHDSFCQSATSRLSAELRTELNLAVMGTDQLPYGVVMGEETPRHAFVSILRIDQLGTELALIIDMPLAQCLVQRLLGGSGTAFGATPNPNMTAVEVAVARRAVSSLVDALSGTWMDLADVTLSMAGTSTNPTAVQLVPSSEPTLLLSLSAAIDVMASVSRLVGEIVTSEVRTAGTHLRKLMAAFRDKEDLIAIGAYQHGSDPVVDEAIVKKGGIEGFLQQPMSERSDGAIADQLLLELAGGGGVDPYGAGDGHDVAFVDNPPPPGGGESAIPPLHLSV
jgi:hypothetical protein